MSSNKYAEHEHKVWDSDIAQFFDINIKGLESISIHSWRTGFTSCHPIEDIWWEWAGGNGVAFIELHVIREGGLHWRFSCTPDDTRWLRKEGVRQGQDLNDPAIAKYCF